MEPKVEKLKAEILKNYEIKIDDLLSICESPIERLMLIQFLRHFSRWGPLPLRHKFDLNSQAWREENNKRFEEEDRAFEAIEFIIDSLVPDFQGYPEANVEELRFGLSADERAKKYCYTMIRGLWEKVIGFKVSSIVRNVCLQTGKTIIKQLLVYPQHEIDVDGRVLRADIAVLLSRVRETEIIETRRIAIECDGHEFHSTKEQKAEDDKRTRALLKRGWKVMRYSGTEIWGIKEEREFDALFAEIMEVFDAL